MIRTVRSPATLVLVLFLFAASGSSFGSDVSGTSGESGLTDSDDAPFFGDGSEMGTPPPTEGTPPLSTGTPLPATGLPGAGGCYYYLPSPNLEMTGTVDYTNNGYELTGYLLSVTNWDSYPEELFEAAPDLPPCGLNNNSSRSWVSIYAENGTRLYGFCALSAPEELQDLWFALDRGATLPGFVYIEIVDRRCDITYTSNAVNMVTTEEEAEEEAPMEESHEITEIYFVDVAESAGSVHRWSPSPSESKPPESPEPEICSSMALDIPQTWTVDLDYGIVGATVGADLWFHAVTAEERYLETMNGATVCKVGGAPPGLSGCMAESLSSSRINIDDLSEGDYLCVLTDEGRCSQVKITKPIAPLSGVLSIDYTTWEKTLPETTTGAGTTGAGTITGASEIIYTRPKGKILSFAFNPESPDELYYVGDSEGEIFRSTEVMGVWGPEVLEYFHDSAVRDLAFGPSDDGKARLYYSEVSEAEGTGTIYELEGGVASIYYEVELSEIGGSWDGDFAMDSEGNLYLSTGREVPASIYSVSGDTLDAIFTDYEDEEPVKGIAYMGGYLYYASYGTEIYRLDLYTGDRREVCTIPGSRLISDVGFRNAKSQICEGCHAVSVDGDL